MNPLSKFIFTVLSFCTIVYTVSSIINFTKFLSNFSSPPQVNLSLATRTLILQKDSNNTNVDTIEALVVDVSLLCLFIIVHSSLVPLQEIVSSILKTPVLNKIFYSLLTSASLQLLIRWWMPIPEYTLWIVNTQEATKLQMFLGVHTVTWILIYAMMITTDITDLLGIKQVYCYITGRPVASSMSEQLKHLHKKMRHPSFLGFTIIFWIYPWMSLDRLLLASVWTLYMLLAWRPDTNCYNYLVQQKIAKNSIM